MTIAVDMGRKATKTNKQTPGRRQSKTLILSTDVDQISIAAYPVCFSYYTRGKFNNASALGRSLYWCQASHIMNKDRYQSTSARRALALLNSPQLCALLDVARNTITNTRSTD